jgi:hypothetical protein
VKRLSIRQKLHNLRVSKARLYRRQELETKRKLALDTPISKNDTEKQDGPGLHEITIYRRGERYRGLARARQAMPENFCLIENYEEVATFLNELRYALTVGYEKLQRYLLEGGSRRALNWKRTVVDNYADFSSLRRITPVTALVLASEYDRAKTLSGSFTDWLRAIDIDLWDPYVSQTLHDVGFLALLGVEKSANLVERNGIITLPFLSGTKVHGDIIDQLIRAMAKAADSTGAQDSDTRLSRSRLYDGLGEAIQNVEDHAYPSGGMDEHVVVKKWWMTGAVEPVKKRFTVAIYDHGVSIPASLPRWTHFDDFRASFSRLVGAEYDNTSFERDGDAIAQAVQLGRSSTGESWHGKGLPVIRDIIENCRTGTVRILSRNGQYECSTGQRAAYSSNKCAITGTLVEWDLLL